MKYGIAFEGGVAGSRKQIEASLDRVMERLVELGAEDPWIGLAFGPDGAKAEITMTVKAATSGDALANATSMIWAAHLAAGSLAEFELEQATLAPVA